jgi:hypothetical protein
MKAGDVVLVYEDPVTEQTPEGKARLVKPVKGEWGVSEGRNLTRWAVRFLDEPGRTFERFILEPSAD